MNDTGKGWYEPERLGQYKNRVSCRIATHGGIMFLSNDTITHEIYKDCKDIATHYSEFGFCMFDKPADEPIIALAMAANGCHPINRSAHYDVYGFYPTLRDVRMDIVSGELAYTFDGVRWVNHVSILHWQNHYTTLPRYKSEVYRLAHGNNVMSDMVSYGLHLCHSIGTLKNRALSWLNRKFIHESL